MYLVNVTFTSVDLAAPLFVEMYVACALSTCVAYMEKKWIAAPNVCCYFHFASVCLIAKYG